MNFPPSVMPWSFLRSVACLVLLLGVSGGSRLVGGTETLAQLFANPPASAQPRTLWFWMNGNVTREGITRDLEAMQKVGLRGAVVFDGSTYLPAGPAAYLQPAWRELMTHALAEAGRLGLELGMHNGPGWSSSGGPWVQPEGAMQQLVWTETIVQGGEKVDVALPRPQTNRGYYRDAYVIAFPSDEAEATRYEDEVVRLSVGGREVATKTTLSDGQRGSSVRLPADTPLVIEFRAALELHALTVLPGEQGSFGALQVEGSEDGVRFTPICRLPSPGRQGIVAPAAQTFPPARARFVRLRGTREAELGEVWLHRTPRLVDWPAKANFDYRVAGQFSLPPESAGVRAIDPAAVVDITSHLQDDRLKWEAPPGAWTILRMGYTPTGKENVAASAAGRGLECDKFSAAAVDRHFDQVIARVQADAQAAGVPGMTAITVDSYEAGMQNWTAAFPEEFRRRTGYEIVRYLPALTGRVVGGTGISERFLFDFRRVQADLMTENYYGRLGERCREAGLTYYIEGYGPGTFDELRISGLPDIPMTEFWTRTPWTPNRAVKLVSSAAHVYGKPIVAAEAFTGEQQTSRWLDYPYALKVLGDDMLAQGVNQFIFHRYAHQPHPTAAPGMTMGPWGFHFDRTNTWFEESAGWLRYLARTQALLQQGSYVADVLYFVGERPPNSAQYAMPVLPPGHTYDLVDAQVLLERVTVQDGHYVLPEGGRYRLLMLPPGLKGMTPALAARLAEFSQQGAAILGPPPQFSPTLQGFPESERAMLGDVEKIWQAPAVWRDRPVADVLRELGVQPDFQFVGNHADTALAWTHRRVEGGDLYFVSNRQRRVEAVNLSFRGMARRHAHVWRPETGKREAAIGLRAEGARAELRLRLEPAESVFVFFEDEEAAALPPLLKEGAAVVGAKAVAPAETEAPGDFTMAIWVKPDTDLRAMPKEAITGRVDEVGKFYAIPADPGEVRFGAGHATAGLAVGRNGVYVIERSNDSAPAVLVASVPIAGWTHVAVTYQDGRPRLYVDGRFVREGLVSGKRVHSGVGAPPPPADYTLHFRGIEALTRQTGQPPPPARGQVYFFEGNSTLPEHHGRALSDGEIAALAAKPLSAPEIPVVSDVVRSAAGVTALAWQSGHYTWGTARAAVEVPAALELAGPWRVVFPAERGAPASVELPELISLHRHPDSSVKYFAGTATYRKTVEISPESLGAGRALVLDLGRVEVIAAVRVNGQAVGTVWKEPYRIDITEAAKGGANTLEIAVTTLWPNRLIGDEHLPAEDEFGLHDELGDNPQGIVRLPEWFLKGAPKPPHGRTTFATWRFYTKDEPLLASGLLGPVRLLNPVVVELATSAEDSAESK